LALGTGLQLQLEQLEDTVEIGETHLVPLGRDTCQFDRALELTNSARMVLPRYRVGAAGEDHLCSNGGLLHHPHPFEVVSLGDVGYPSYEEVSWEYFPRCPTSGSWFDFQQMLQHQHADSGAFSLRTEPSEYGSGSTINV